MSVLKPFVIATALATVASVALANDLNGINLQQKGVSLSVNGTATLVVPNDQAQMYWSTQAQAPTLKEATEEVIKTMNANLETLKSMKGNWELQTQGFNSYPVYSETKGEKAPKIVAWRVSQSLFMRVHDVTQVPTIIEKLSGSLALDQLSFSVSDQARQGYDATLIRMAVNDATKRATIVADSLGRKANKVEMQNMRFSGSSAPRMEYGLMRANAKVANDAMPTPAIEAGSSTLNMTVTTDVIIKR